MCAELGGFVDPAHGTFERLVGEALADVIKDCECTFRMAIVPVVHCREEFAFVLWWKAFFDVAEVDAGDVLAVRSECEFLREFEAWPRVGARQSQCKSRGKSVARRSVVTFENR